MQIPTKDFLRLVENAGTLGFVDIESTGLNGDYNSILVVSIKPYRKPAFSLVVKQPGNDQKIAREAGEALEALDMWVTHYGKGFDIPMLQSRRLRWGLSPIEKRPHLDTYFLARSRFNLARNGMAHISDWLETKKRKMSMSADEWVKVVRCEKGAIKRMVKRCESDVEELEDVYECFKPFIENINR